MADDGIPRLVARIHAYRTARLDALTDRLVEVIVEGNPGYRESGVVPVEDLRHSCANNIGRVLELLATGLGSGDGPGMREGDLTYDAARATGKRRAQQGLPLDDVLRSFRLGGRLIWDDVIAEAGDLDVADLREIGTCLWEAVDATSAQVAAAYHHTERTLVRADEQLRAQLWDGVLGGRAREAGFAHEAGQTLGISAGQPLLVVIAPDLDVTRAPQVLAPHESQFLQRTHDVVGLVVPRAADAGAAHQVLARLARESGTTIACSRLVGGLGEADAAFQQASLTLRGAAAKPARLAKYDDHLPDALLLRSPDLAAHLVEAWLGPILELPESDSRILLDTLRAWVDSRGSATRTAEVVHCHRNTVLNRLQRLTSLTGRELSGEAPVELALALRAVGHGAQMSGGDPGRDKGGEST